MKLTETEKAEMIKKAAKLYNRAYRNRKEAEKILETLGIYTCSENEGYYKGAIEPEVQIYSGIKKLESENLKIAAKPKAFSNFKDNENIGWIKIDGINFFQMKTPIGEDSYGLK